MSFPQLGFPQFLSASHEVYGSERPASAARDGGAEGSAVSSSATAAAVGSMLGMYGSPWAAPNYSAFLPYSGAADLALISQMVRAGRLDAQVLEDRSMRRCSVFIFCAFTK